MNRVIKKIILDLFIFASRTIYGIEDSVLFICYGGKYYADNPRAISEALHKKFPNIKIIWLIKNLEDSESFPHYVRLLNRKNTLEYYKAIGTTKVIVDNSSSIPIIHKAKNQFFIQTWHGDRAFKKIMYDAREFKKNEVGESIEGFYNLAISGSDYGDMQYRSAFRYQGDILKTGTPRDDCLVKQDPQKIKEIKEKLGIGSKKVLLYAPTFRKKYKIGAGKQIVENIDIASLIDLLRKKREEEWIGLLRGHPDIKGLTGYNDNSLIMDVSSYPDMADLLLIADILVTDYSSCAGDFALTKKLVVLYQPDLEEYINNDRSLYFSMETSPFFVVRTQEELEEKIICTDRKEAERNCEEILSFYNTIESGESSKTVANIIAQVINK